MYEIKASRRFAVVTLLAFLGLAYDANGQDVQAIESVWTAVWDAPFAFGESVMLLWQEEPATSNTWDAVAIGAIGQPLFIDTGTFDENVRFTFDQAFNATELDEIGVISYERALVAGSLVGTTGVDVPTYGMLITLVRPVPPDELRTVYSFLPMGDASSLADAVLKVTNLAGEIGIAEPPVAQSDGPLLPKNIDDIELREMVTILCFDTAARDQCLADCDDEYDPAIRTTIDDINACNQAQEDGYDWCMEGYGCPPGSQQAGSWCTFAHYACSSSWTLFTSPCKYLLAALASLEIQKGWCRAGCEVTVYYLTVPAGTAECPNGWEFRGLVADEDLGFNMPVSPELYEN